MAGMVEPTFVIGGAQRCGTTWLYHLLDQHPQIHLARPINPEPKFFCHDPAPGRDRDWYLRTWFADVPADAIAIGEKSTSYIDTPGVPQRIGRMLPDLKIVFMLRHPVERAISNYRFSKINGLETESIEVAFRQEATRVAQTRFANLSVHPLAYVERGHYVRCLDGFIECMGRDRIKVLIKEHFERDPLKALADLLRFLGVEPGFEPTGVDARHNVTDDPGLRIPHDLVGELIEIYRPSNRRLEQLLGRDLGEWNRPSPMIEAMLV